MNSRAPAATKKTEAVAEGTDDDHCDCHNDMARLTSSILSMGFTAEVYRCDVDGTFLMPSSRKHSGLYSSTVLGDCEMAASSRTADTAAHITGGVIYGIGIPPPSEIEPRVCVEEDNHARDPEGGVPGFPDFPAFWDGREGVRESVGKKRARGGAGGKGKSASTKRFARKSVNAPYHCRGSGGWGSGAGRNLKKRTLKEIRRIKREDTLRKMDRKRRKKGEMRGICRDLALLRCA